MIDSQNRDKTSFRFSRFTKDFFMLSFNSLMNEVVHTSPTIGSNVEEIVVKNTHFLMWDIGGQESLRSSWNTYYSNTEVSKLSSEYEYKEPKSQHRKEIGCT